MFGKNKTTRSLLLTLALVAGAAVRATPQQTICAVVKMNLSQQAALEREAFNANLDLTNNLGTLPLSSMQISIIITDANGNSAEQLFFVKVNSLTGLQAVDGTGIVQPAGQASASWLIIPSPGAGGSSPAGTQYTVQAQMSFNTGGIQRVTTTFPVNITVFPQPLINLEYALPFEVFSVDPFTMTGSTVPFPLGLRVVNVGSGTATNFQITSAQPTITDNKQGLAVNFALQGTYLGSTQLTSNSLTIPFGDVPPGGAKQAAWIMTSSLSGRFIDFTSTFTHAAELGGALTSLIQSASTYTLIKDILVDLPDRDNQFDFLINRFTSRSQMEANYQLGQEPQPDAIMESDRPGFTPVVNATAHLVGALSGNNGVLGFAFDQPLSTGVWTHASIPFVQGSSVALVSAIRADGKVLNPHNAWIAPHIDKTTNSRVYFLHVLDYSASTAAAANYAMSFNAASLDAPPDPITTLSISTTGPGTASLSWTATGEDGSTGTVIGGRYAIFVSSDLTAVPSVAAAALSFSTTTPALAPQTYALNGLLGNTTYQVAVFIADAAGHFTSSGNVVDAFVLAAPPSIQASSITTSSFALSWSTAVNSAGARYRVQVATASGVVAGDTGFGTDSSSASFSGLGVDQSYLVSALMQTSSLIPSPPVVIATVTTLAVPPTPAASAVVAESSSTLTVQWQYGADPADTEFYAELSTSSGFTSALYPSGWVRAASALIAGLSPQTTYYARVTARNRAAVPTAAVALGAGQTSAASILPATGATGTAFTLTGANFGPYAAANTRVRFGAGGPTATVSSWTGARINGVVPNLAPGTYTVLVERQNGASVNILNAGTFAVLSGAPASGVTIALAPADGDQITVNQPAIAATYAAALGVDTTTVLMIVDGAIVAPVVSTAEADFTPVAALAEGTHTVTASVADLSGTVATTTATFLVDTIAPVTTLAVDGLTVGTTALTVVSTDSISLAATDAGSGVADTVYLIDTNPNSCDFSSYVSTAPVGTCANPYYAGPFTLAAGTHTVAFYSDDGAGNSEDYNYVGVTVAPVFYTSASGDGVVTLRSPLAGETIVAVSSPSAAAAALAQHLTASTSFYDLEPSGVAFTPAAALSFQFNPGAVSTSNLAIYTFNGVAWTSAPITGQTVSILSSATVLLSGSLPHASLYGVFGPASSTPTPVALSVSSISPASAVANGFISAQVTGTGFDSSSLLRLEHFRVAGGSWSATGAMANARMYAGTVKLKDGRVLVAGGFAQSGVSALNSVEIFDPATGAWTTAAPMATPRFSMTMVLLKDGRVLAAGGRTGTTFPDTAAAEIYDPAANSWTPTASMPTGVDQSLSVLLADGRVLAAGGMIYSGSPQWITTAQIYDPVAGTWSATTSMAAPHTEGGITTLRDGRVLVVAGAYGLSGTFVAGAEIFDPVANAWSSAGSVATARELQAQALLPDGRVMVAGGIAPSGFLTSSEIYDPVANAWSAGPNINLARYVVDQTLTVDGRMMMVGGYTASGAVTAVDVYEPAANIWKVGAPLTTPRVEMTPVQLADGRVLAAGGYDASGGAVASAELLTMPVTVVAATSVGVLDAQHLTGALNLTGATTGYWDVVVRESGNRIGRLSGAFQVLAPPDTTPPAFSNAQVSQDGVSFTAAASTVLTSNSADFARITVTDAGSGVSLRGFSTPYAWVGGLSGSNGALARIDTTNGSVTTFAVPSSVGSAVDASGNVWLAGAAASKVYKVNPANGAYSTYDTGGTPSALAVDGAGNVFVVNSGAGLVKLRGSDGGVIWTSNASGVVGPFSVVVDASGDPWVPNANNSNVSKLDGATGALLGTYPVGTYPEGAAIDGAGHVWVANTAANTVTELNAADGSLVGTFAAGADPDGMAFDADGNMWTADFVGNSVSKLAPNGTTIGTYAVGSGPIGVSIDANGNVWVVNTQSDSVTELRGSDGAVLGTFATGVHTQGNFEGDSTGFALQYFTLKKPLGTPTVFYTTNSWATSTRVSASSITTVLASGGSAPAGPYLVTAAGLSLADSTTQNQVAFTVADNAGNVATSTLTVSVHLTAPTLSVTTVTPSSATAGATTSLAVTGSGFDGSAALTLEHFRVAAGTWAAGGAMVTARIAGSFALLRDGRVLAAGGYSASGASLNAAELYDPVSGTWSAAAPMASARYAGTLVVMNDGRVLAAGGRASSGDDIGLAEIYDPAANSWTATSPMLSGVEQALTAVLPDGRVLLAGGYIHAGDQHLATSQIYDPVAGTWSSAPSMSNPRTGGSITVLKNGRALVAGGYNGGASATAELFDGPTNSWLPAGAMTAGRYGQAQVLLADGRVIAAGGNQVGVILNTSEIYDPTTNAWTAGPNLNAPHAPGLQAVAVDGRAVVMGGDGYGSYSAAVDVYEPAANLWRAAAPLLKARSNTVALQLNDGRVLIAGGSSGSYSGPAAETSSELMTMPVTTTTATGLAIADAQHLSGSVNLAGAATGYWDVVVRESSNRVGRLSGGFDVVVPFVALTLTSIAVIPSSATLIVGTTQAFTAIGYFSDGSSQTLTGAAGAWTRGPNTLQPRWYSAAATVNGRFYVIGGYPTQSMEMYDPATGAWTLLAAPPVDRSLAQATVVGNTIYVFGGCVHADCNSITTDNWAYDTIANTWTRKASLPVGRQGMAADALGGKIYAAGGYTSGYVPNASLTVYDPVADAWTTKASMPVARGYGGVGAVGGVLYYTGGSNNGFGQPVAPQPDAFAYDPVADAWTTRASIPVPLAYQGSAVLNGKIYMTGGYNTTAATAVTATWVYDPTANAWSAGAPTNDARALAATAASGNTLFTAGGVNGQASASFEYETTTAGVAWSSDSPAVATVTANGLATAVSSGTAHVVASSGTVTGSATVNSVLGDTTPPVTTIAFSTPSFVSSGTLVAVGTRSSATLSAVDLTSGTVAASGVAATYYAVDSSTPSILYTGAFMLSTGTHTVFYRSVDLAGNAEAVSSVTVPVYSGPFVGALSVSSGPIGAPLSLYGFNFGAYAGSVKSRLYFGVSTAPVSVWNDALVSVTVPGLAPGAYALTLQALVGASTQTVSVGTFTVLTPAIASVVPSSGPIGISFTMTGSAFGPYAGSFTQVLLGGTTTPISIWNDASITATVPGILAPGSYPVQVRRTTSDGGLSLSNTSSFTVVGLGVATVNPSTGPIGISFTLSGAGFGTYNGANTQVLLGGTSVAISVWNNTSITGTVPALSTGSYPLAVERIQGNAAAFSAVTTFTVTALTLSAPIPSTGPIGASFTLSGNGFGAYSGANTRLLIGGTTAAVSVWSDASITGVVPGNASQGAQAVWLERLSGSGLESSNTVYFTVTAPAIASVFPSSGPIGVSFTLSGSGFGTYNGANTQLLIAGTTAPITVWNDTTITATVPGALAASTGVATVVVERIGTGGVSLSTAASFLVLTPAPTSVTPSSGPIGGSFTVYGAAFGAYNGANTQLLLGGATTAVSIWNDRQITATVPALSSGAYAVVVQRAQGGYLQSGGALSFTVSASQIYGMTPSSAPIGAPFTITGASFGAYNGTNTRVKFNGLVAPITVWNDTTISGTVPGALSTGPASVVVERAVGTSVASASAPAFLSLTPTISTISPNFGLSGTAVTLTGFGFGPYSGASGTQLLVGGSTMAVAVWNDTTVRWTVPATLANGLYPVVVRRTPAGGSVQSSSANFTVGSFSLGALSASRTAPALAQRPDVDFVGDLSLPAAEGGTILTPSQAAVTIPPNALASDTEVTLARDRSSYASARTSALGQAALGAAGEAISFGPEGTQFSAPVTLELPYDPALVPAGALSGLRIHYFDPVAKTWTPLSSTVDSVRHVVIAQTTHFSLYQPLGPGVGVLAADATFGLKAAYAFPNPVHSGAVTIRIQPGQADSVSVRVYDLSGRKVHESSNFTLNAALDDGNGLGAQFTYDHVWDISGVGSGVYTYVITAKKSGQSDIHKTGKIGVSK